MQPNLIVYKCPSCGVTHAVEMMDDEEEEDYDGLCPDCEEDWVESDEYKDILKGLG